MPDEGDDGREGLHDLGGGTLGSVVMQELLGPGVVDQSVGSGFGDGVFVSCCVFFSCWLCCDDCLAYGFGW